MIIKKSGIAVMKDNIAVVIFLTAAAAALVIAAISIITVRNTVALMNFILFASVTVSLICGGMGLNHYRTKAKQNAAAMQSKNSFISTISREIRTPLNAIIEISQSQLQKGDLTYGYAMALGQIYNSGNSMLRIINDLLDLSFIDAGRLNLTTAEYNTPDLINDVMQLSVVHIGSKPIKFYLDVDESLPLKLYGDELRLKQMLNNLLSYAIKYTDRGYIKLAVNHTEENGDITLCFTVEDTGQRFNIENNHAAEGAGLGLSITKKLAELMGGTIKVENEYRKGSIFTVTVKQKAMNSSVIGAGIVEQLCSFTFTASNQAAKLLATHEPMPYGRVLVVDDMRTNLIVAVGFLAPYKLKIDTAKSGFESINKIENGNTYDIIFLDHLMPQMDGIETAKKLRSLGYAGVIVALTANALAGNDEMFSRNGFDDFITKPIDARHLDKVLNKFIASRRYEEQIVLE